MLYNWLGTEPVWTIRDTWVYAFENMVSYMDLDGDKNGIAVSCTNVFKKKQ